MHIKWPLPRRKIGSWLPVRWMVNSIICRNVWNQKWIYSFQATDVVAVLIRKGASLMMRVDAAVRAEEVFCDSRIELVEPEV